MHLGHSCIYQTVGAATLQKEPEKEVETIGIGAKEEHSTKLYVGKPTYTKVRLIRLRPLLHQTPKTLFYILGVD